MVQWVSFCDVWEVEGTGVLPDFVDCDVWKEQQLANFKISVSGTGFSFCMFCVLLKSFDFWTFLCCLDKDENWVLGGLEGSWRPTITIPHLLQIPQQSLFVVRSEGLIAPLNPRLMVSRMYLTLKGALRQDIKGVAGWWREKIDEDEEGKPFEFFCYHTCRQKRLIWSWIRLWVAAAEVGSPGFIQIWSLFFPPPSPSPPHIWRGPPPEKGLNGRYLGEKSRGGGLAPGFNPCNLP